MVKVNENNLQFVSVIKLQVANQSIDDDDIIFVIKFTSISLAFGHMSFDLVGRSGVPDHLERIITKSTFFYRCPIVKKIPVPTATFFNCSCIIF